MATIRRAGFGTVFELEDSKVGIGTDAATHTLQALGNIRSEDATDIGISSLTTYQGFVDKEARFTTGQIDNQSQSGSTSGEIVIDGDVTVSSATTFTSGPQNLTVTDTFTLPSGDTNSRALKPTAGSLRFNQDFATLEFYTGNNWATVNTFTEMQNSPGNRGRGFFVGGGSDAAPTGTDINEFIEISSQGNTINFGDLAQGGIRMFGACGSATRGLIGGGYKPAASPTAVVDIIEYFTMASSGNTIDFGNLSDARGEVNACSSSTRGVWVAGEDVPFADMNILDYVEIATLGNALDFGDLTEDVRDPQAFASPVRGVRSGGNDNTDSDISETIDFWKFASKGNATRFGDLITRLGGPANCSSNIRGFMLGGSSSPSKTNFIQYITIASEGNATFFGDLNVQDATNACGTSNSTRGIKAGGANPSNTNAIEFFNMSTAGNSADFGDLSIPRNNMGSTSDSHGGLGGF